MEVRHGITLHLDVIKRDIPRLDTLWRQTVRNAIREKLTTRPEVHGKPLRQSLKGCRTFRVGDYRVVFQIQQKTVHILAIIHRSSNYAGVEKRL